MPSADGDPGCVSHRHSDVTPSRNSVGQGGRVTLSLASRVKGCLLGGAVGDALGAPVRGKTHDEIRRRFPDGVLEFVPSSLDGDVALGRITDDTQMTLFTIEGIIRAINREVTRGLGFTNAVVHHAYLRWYDTQVLDGPPLDAGDERWVGPLGWLGEQAWLYSRRSTEDTCMAALQGGIASVAGGLTHFGDLAQNDSKSCGGVVRSAPYGWLSDGTSDKFIYELAVEAAGYTHGHPTGKVAAGALALIIGYLMQGDVLDVAVKRTLSFLARRKHAGETVTLLRKARELARQPEASEDPVIALRSLGAGFAAEEALAIGVFAAAVYSDATQALDALSLSVSQGSNSNATGSICGNILGAFHGEEWVPGFLAFRVEGRSTMLELADDFVYVMGDLFTPSSDLPMILDVERNERFPNRRSPGDLHLLDTRAWFERYPPG